MKALGKKMPGGRYWSNQELYTIDKSEHYRQALLEAADELEVSCGRKQPCSCTASRVAKKLRISAGD